MATDWQFGETLRVTETVVALLDSLGVPYYVAGSVASSIYGLPRATNDVDLVASLAPEHLEGLLSGLGSDFYVGEGLARSAIAEHRSFNVIHLATMFKVDIFVMRPDVYSRAAMARRTRTVLEAGGTDGTSLMLASPEDTVAHKLSWYQQGGCVSDRQWSDVLGVLKARHGSLDLRVLREAATALLVDPQLLERALDASGWQRRGHELWSDAGEGT